MRTALGKGLDALISQETAQDVSASGNKGVQKLPIHQVKPNPKQPRRIFVDGPLQDLAASIKEHGIIQPIVVSRLPSGTYEIIAGERRWRAAQLAGLSEIPAVVKDVTETQRFQLALIENIQREDLNAIEQAEGFRRLMDEFEMTQEEIAKALGKDRGVIANTVRLLNLPTEIRQALLDGKLSAGHARSLVALEDPLARQNLFKRIILEQLSVRAVEDAARTARKQPVKKKAAPKAVEARALEEDLQRLFGRKVQLKTTDVAGTKGSLEFEFYSVDDLEGLVSQFKNASKK